MKESCLLQFNPKNRPFISEVQEACRLLRRTGAEWIRNRKIAMQNGEDVPKDILTQIIKSAGKGEEPPAFRPDLTMSGKAIIAVVKVPLPHLDKK